MFRRWLTLRQGDRDANAHRAAGEEWHGGHAPFGAEQLAARPHRAASPRAREREGPRDAVQPERAVEAGRLPLSPVEQVWEGGRVHEVRPNHSVSQGTV